MLGVHLGRAAETQPVRLTDELTVIGEGGDVSDTRGQASNLILPVYWLHSRSNNPNTENEVAWIR